MKGENDMTKTKIAIGKDIVDLYVNHLYEMTHGKWFSAGWVAVNITPLIRESYRYDSGQPIHRKLPTSSIMVRVMYRGIAIVKYTGKVEENYMFTDGEKEELLIKGKRKLRMYKMIRGEQE